MVGNPPFLGGNQISTRYSMDYFAWLTNNYDGTGGICDLVAYFFRRTFQSIRDKGTLGLIATKTIAEGETRQGGLMWIRMNNGVIYEAMKRLAWPGQAAVIVSVVYIAKGTKRLHGFINGRKANEITSYLFHAGGDDLPQPIDGKNELFSQGTNPRSPGFIFDNDDIECLPLSETQKIVEQGRLRQAERIFPYLGGEEVNQNPRQEHSRYIIYLDDIESLEELRQYPDLERLVREKVKPGRDSLSTNPNNDKLRRRWWAYHASRREFYNQIRRRERVLVNCQVSNHVCFTFQPVLRIFALTLNIYDLDDYSSFCTLQSRPHEVWARFFGSHMKDDLRYTPSTCFETFPFPENFEADPKLEAIGKEYYEFRAALMVKNNEGLTKTYNRFHDPNETSPEIHKLRVLHAAMDRAVLDAYGWTDLQPTCEFLLDYEDEDEEDGNGESGAGSRGKRGRKKPWRYRWPDDFRDEVLARLLELNKKRAEEERLAGAGVGGRGKRRKKGS